MNVLFAIVGTLIAFGSFLSGAAIYTVAKSSIHEIYGALLMITSVLGLVVAAIGTAAVTIRRAILDEHNYAVAQRTAIVEALNIILAAQHESSMARAQDQLR